MSKILIFKNEFFKMTASTYYAQASRRGGGGTGRPG